MIKKKLIILKINLFVYINKLNKILNKNENIFLF